MLENAASKVRYLIGSALVLLGAAAAVWSPFRPWYDGRHGRDYGIGQLFDGITGNRSPIMESIMLPMIAAALLAVIGVLMRSRIAITLAALVVLATVVLWMIRQGQVADGLTVNADGTGMDIGVANAWFAAVSMLLGVAIMGNPRRAKGRRRKGDTIVAPAPTSAYERGREHAPEPQPQPETAHPLPDAMRRRAPQGVDPEQTADGAPPRFPDDRAA
ncbi:hypothetical protein G5C51_31240 [Streptomyces sp. A7024]|uniref:Uncharacterized protein n=1 Tax=Streptomyces coryli TaxID=1128680 RepID=A0A6G4UAZ2_9ACTN|nr:hypothetical protein [Streptomyces coryli]NGN68361.1 hypothetical protein [Streptomyces coryli]